METKKKSNAGRKPKLESLKLRTRTVSFIDAEWMAIEAAAEMMGMDWKKLLIQTSCHILNSAMEYVNQEPIDFHEN